MHQLNKGCIIADEMGLGKTIEIVAFLAALHFTMILKNEPKNILYNKQKVLNENFDNILNCQNKNTSFIFPFINALIVCPATVIQQWVHEFHEWYPFFRCFTTCKRILQERQKVIKKASCFGSILIVSYETLRHDFVRGFLESIEIIHFKYNIFFFDLLIF
jgi:SNF2 family DNA or RNA helicase